ncbi:MAG: hypothetical protein ACXVCY_14475 [Pseudobdellovibrionaceae bacterium]
MAFVRPIALLFLLFLFLPDSYGQNILTLSGKILPTVSVDTNAPGSTESTWKLNILSNSSEPVQMRIEDEHHRKVFSSSSSSGSSSSMSEFKNLNNQNKVYRLTLTTL